jgi:hypothetical protein
VPEVRRLLQAVGEAEELQARRLRWSHFRRQHQGRAQRFHRLRRARQAPAVSVNPPAPLRLLGVPARDFRALGATTSALAPTEASDGPSRHRSSPHRGRHALGRTYRFLPFGNCPSVLDRGRRWPVAINAGCKRVRGHASCTSCFRLRLRSCPRLEPFKWDCSMTITATCCL